ncbi:MAG: hypothetical protein IJS08_04335 [Victivallales bacterium]|nr:hypothetical protein [Victivallales bacterium]
MPLPLIPIIIGAGAAALGIGKTIKAASDNSTAKAINEEAQETIDKAKSSLESARNATKSSLDDLGKRRLNVIQTSIKHFLESSNKLRRVDMLMKDVNGLSDLNLTPETIKELKELNDVATTLTTGAATGAIAGALTAFGAYGAAGTFAAASTGTAIASLSGAAATNATLAFFGGGSLAAGGLGIAGGTMVLGGLVAGPALAIMGLVAGSKATANLENARSNRSIAEKTAAECKTMVTTCEAIQGRAHLYIHIIDKLEQYFTPLLDRMDEIIEKEGSDYSRLSKEAQNTVCACFATVQPLKDVIVTPLLDSNGSLTQNSLDVAEKANEELNKAQDVSNKTNDDDWAIVKNQVQQIYADFQNSMKELNEARERVEKAKRGEDID